MQPGRVQETFGSGSQEPTEKALLQGEGGARLPLLFALRQDLSRGHSSPCLCVGPRQCGSAGCGWSDLQTDRRVGRGGVAGGLARGTRFEDVSARSGAAGDDPEAGGRRTSTRHPRHGGHNAPHAVGVGDAGCRWAELATHVRRRLSSSSSIVIAYGAFGLRCSAEMTPRSIQ